MYRQIDAKAHTQVDAKAYTQVDAKGYTHVYTHVYTPIKVLWEHCPSGRCAGSLAAIWCLRNQVLAREGVLRPKGVWGPSRCWHYLGVGTKHALGKIKCWH